MNRYRAEAYITTSAGEGCTEGVSHEFVVTGTNAKEAYENALQVVSVSDFKEAKLYGMDEVYSRLADTVEDVKNLYDLYYLDYRCLGHTKEVYPDLPNDSRDVFDRCFLWENAEGRRVVSRDSGNGSCFYFCGGAKEELVRRYEQI